MTEGLAGLHLRQRLLGGVDRHRKRHADVHIVAGRVFQQSIDANHLALTVQEWASRVAGVHRRVCLNHVSDGPSVGSGAVCPAGGAYDTLG